MEGEKIEKETEMDPMMREALLVLLAPNGNYVQVSFPWADHVLAMPLMRVVLASRSQKGRGHGIPAKKV